MNKMSEVVGASPKPEDEEEEPSSSSSEEDSETELSAQNEEQGNIFISKETFDLEKARSEERQALLADFERRKRARLIQVSTDDKEVKRQLREYGRPICFFGEDAADRRNRLKDLISTLGEEIIVKQRKVEKVEEVIERGSENNTWHHEGSEALRRARLAIAEFSLHNTRRRLERARMEEKLSSATKNALTQEVHKAIRGLSISCSQVGDSRPISFASFSPDESMIATSSWSGLVKLWNLPDCSPVRTFAGHNQSAGCVVWHPKATKGLSENGPCLASSSNDGTIKFWSLNSNTPVLEIDEYMPYRVSRVRFHPLGGRFLGACVWDHSWRLYDIEYRTEILHQEGHSEAVFDIAFQDDGSVAVSGGLDAYGRVWDLRTGRCIMFMDGHLKSILSVSFHANGYHMATGSEDNTCKIWDLRQRRCCYTIPAHSKLVSGVKFAPRSGQFIITSSYDCTSKIWAHPLWQPLKTLAGHDSKLMALDISAEEGNLVTASFDRTFKLWTNNI